MTTKPTLDDALKAVRDHDVPSMMSVHEIQNVLGTTPTPPSYPSATPSSTVSWIVAGTITAAAAGGLYWAATTDSSELQEQATTTPSIVAPTSTVPPASTPAPSHDGPSPATPLQMRGIAPSMVEATTRDLHDLGITYDGRMLRYRDDQAVVTITTSGISVVEDRTQASAEPQPPRMVTLFRNGTHFAAWWDQTDADAAAKLRTQNIAPNDLVPVSILLRDSASSLFREATVVLWFPAFRSGLEQYTERHVREGVITASALYPNPLRNGDPTLSVTISEERTASIDVYDMQGNAVVHIADDQALVRGTQTIPLVMQSPLPTGMYVVVMRTNHNEQIMQRLMIER